MAALLRYLVPVQWAGICKIFLFNKHNFLKKKHFVYWYLVYSYREVVFMRDSTPGDLLWEYFSYFAVYK